MSVSIETESEGIKMKRKTAQMSYLSFIIFLIAGTMLFGMAYYLFLIFS